MSKIQVFKCDNPNHRDISDVTELSEDQRDFVLCQNPDCNIELCWEACYDTFFRQCENCDAWGCSQIERFGCGFIRKVGDDELCANCEKERKK